MKTQPIETIAETEALVSNHDPAVKERARMEVRVIRETLLTLRAAGYELSIDDPMDDEREDTGTVPALLRLIMATDESTLRVRKAGAKNSFVLFVLGNSGFDVVCDYGVSLEEVLEPVFRLCEFLEEGGNVYCVPEFLNQNEQGK